MSVEISIVYGDVMTFNIEDVVDDQEALVDLGDGQLVFTARRHVRSDEDVFVMTTSDGIEIVAGDPVNDATLTFSEAKWAEATAAGLTNDFHVLPFEIRFWRSGVPQTPISGVLRVTPGIGEEP